MNGPLVLCAGALTLTAAFLVGRGLAGAPSDGGGSTPDPGEVPSLERRIADLTRQLADERALRLGGDAVRGPGRERAESDGPRVGASSASSTAFSLDGATTGADVSKRLMAFVDAQLRRGAAGHEQILGAMNEVWSRRRLLKDLFQDETMMSRVQYPWIRLLVIREPQMLDLSEFVFRRMAETPEAFADTADADVLQVFTEGVGSLLPGAVDEERLARFRAYAAQILATPAAAQPDAVRGSRARIERLLAHVWPTPLTSDQALARLRSGVAPARELTRLLRLVPSEELATLDLTALIAPLVRAGNSEVMGMIGWRPLDHLDLARLDDALLEAADAGTANGWTLSTCFQRTGRKQWSEVRPFFDKALAQSDASAAAALQALAVQLPKELRPDRAYVEELLARRTVPETTQAQLRAAYGIK